MIKTLASGIASISTDAQTDRQVEREKDRQINLALATSLENIDPKEEAQRRRLYLAALNLTSTTEALDLFFENAEPQVGLKLLSIQLAFQTHLSPNWSMLLPSFVSLNKPTNYHENPPPRR